MNGKMSDVKEKSFGKTGQNDSLHFGGFVILNRTELLQKKADSYDETLYFHDIF